MAEGYLIFAHSGKISPNLVTSDVFPIFKCKTLARRYKWPGLGQNLVGIPTIQSYAGQCWCNSVWPDVEIKSSQSSCYLKSATFHNK